MKQSAKHLTSAALLLAMGIVLPQLFHLLGGQATGSTLLPMHIPVLMGGLLLGPWWGLALGLICPVLSFILTAMPPAPILPFMIAELAGYGLMGGLMARQGGNVWVSLGFAQVCGRLLRAVSLLATVHLFQLSAPPVLTVWTAVIAGIPGIIIQWVFIPPLVLLARRAISLEHNTAAR